MKKKIGRPPIKTEEHKKRLKIWADYKNGIHETVKQAAMSLDVSESALRKWAEKHNLL